jgi:hypothetical protein
MIAQLKFKFGQKPVIAQLCDELKWHSDEKSVETYLNELDLFPRSSHADVKKDPKLHVYRVAYRLGADVQHCQSDSPHVHAH